MIDSDSRENIASRVKEQADIVQIIGECIDLKRSGVRLLGLCPFHGEKTPSFSVHEGQQFFHCFGCGESGDVFSFMMKYHNLDFPEALKELANKYNIELPERRRSKEEMQNEKKREMLFTVNKKCADIYSNYLQNAKGATTARKYLGEREVSPEIIEKYGIGYAPDVEVEGWNFLGNEFNKQEIPVAVEAGLLAKKKNGGTYDRFRDRIVFPIYDISGRVCGFGGRIVGEGQPKYLNSPESPVFNKSKTLLGLYQQKETIRKSKRAIIVEGNFDLISLVANGCENVVAPLGTALTREQLRLLKRFASEVILFFDGDEAGKNAAVRGVPLFLAEQVSGHVAKLPSGHDPDTFVRENGVAQLNQLLNQAESLPEFVLSSLVDQYGLTLDGKSKIVDALIPLVKAAVSPLQRSVFISHFAEHLGLPVAHFESLLEPLTPSAQKIEKKVVTKKRREGQVAPLSMAQKRLVEFMVLHPSDLNLLEEGGIRECLLGGVGEILFLQLKRMVTENGEIEPEDLLTMLPEGAERKLVSDVLLQASLQVQEATETEGRREIDDILGYLNKHRLEKQSEELMKRIEDAASRGDFEQLQLLMAEKTDISMKLQMER